MSKHDILIGTTLLLFLIFQILYDKRKKIDQPLASQGFVMRILKPKTFSETSFGWGLPFQTLKEELAFIDAKSARQLVITKA